MPDPELFTLGTSTDGSGHLFSPTPFSEASEPPTICPDCGRPLHPDTYGRRCSWCPYQWIDPTIPTENPETLECPACTGLHNLADCQHDAPELKELDQ